MDTTREWIGTVYGNDGIQRFWDKLNTSDPDACWLWPHKSGRTDRYGAFAHNYVRENAHRIALELHLERPVTTYVLHSCDVPACCNPKHLREGTASDNSRDMWIRGRQRAFGGKLDQARKVTEVQIEAACELRALGAPTYLVAQAMGLNASSVQKYYQKWRALRSG